MGHTISTQLSLLPRDFNKTNQKYNSCTAVKGKRFTTVDDTYKMRDRQFNKKDENGCSSIHYQFNLSHKPR